MQIIVSGNLRRFVGFQKMITFESNTVAEGIAQLVAQYPAAKPIILDSQNRVRGVHRLFLNEELLAPDDLNQPTSANDEVRIVTAVAGG